VSPKEKIAKLERLLTRVKERAEVPRPNGAVAFAVPAAAQSFTRPPLATTVSEPPMEVMDGEASFSEDVSFETSVLPNATLPPDDGEPTLGPGEGEPTESEIDQDAVTKAGRRAYDEAHEALKQAMVTAEAEGAFEKVGAQISVELEPALNESEARLRGGPAQVSIDGDAEVEGDRDVSSDTDSVEVEVSAEVVELEIDEETAAAMPAESGAQPVAEHVVPDDAAVDLSATVVESVEIHGDAPAELEEVTEEPPEVVVTMGAALANEVEEPAPTSSPRPIGPTVTSYVTSTTDEEESAPRHTPPPESGKQVAVASVKPEPRLSSIPPATKGPEITRADLSQAAGVAAIEGAVPTFRVSTFGELLDASLGL
jgi:hypothetical protein